MKIFEGKTPTERNKLIAAIVLGVMAVIALTYTFSGMFFSSKKKTTVAVSISPTPTPKTSTTGNPQNASLPSQDDQIFIYTTTPVVYNPDKFYAPDPGRNIFAFYEPPPPTPYVTPEVVLKPQMPIPTPIPTPPPPIQVGFVTPQSVYSGSKTFRLEVSGDKFTPDSVILFNGSQLPTTYISPQKLVADIPANLISDEGAKVVTVIAPGGLYSNNVSLNVQAPPTPGFQYIGMIARKRYNNDTAYFQEEGKQVPISGRLNDIVGGRFRLVSISPEETIFEDVNLGFKHKLALYRPEPGQSSTYNNPNTPRTISPNGIPNRVPRGDNGTQFNNQYNQTVPAYTPPQVEIPGIPSSIPRYNPTPQKQQTPAPKTNDDDDDDGDN
ncbi:MAG: hypothetical protein ABI891_15845 [Acidobacteriota bacterium]